MNVKRNIEGRSVLQILDSIQVIMPVNPMEGRWGAHFVTALLLNVTSIIKVCYYLIFYLF